MYKLKPTLQTLVYLWGKSSLLFASSVEVNFYRSKFNTHITNYSKEVTLDRVIISGLLNYYLVVICSFLDEWNNEFTPNNHKEFSGRILQLKKYTKPILKRINQWSGIKDFRNIILAHNLREKGGESVFNPDSKVDFNKPVSSNDYLLINNLLNALMKYTLTEFQDVKLELDKSLGDYVKVNTESDESNDEVINILIEVEKLKNDY